jgi:hypothetical protein
MQTNYPDRGWFTFHNRDRVYAVQVPERTFMNGTMSAAGMSGLRQVTVGDWIVIGTHGEPLCFPDEMFRSKYVPVSEQMAVA